MCGKQGILVAVYSGTYIVQHQSDETHVNILVKQKHFMTM